MTVLDEILATKRDEVTMLHRPQVRDLLRAQALDAPAARDFAGALRPASGTLGVSPRSSAGRRRRATSRPTSTPRSPPRPTRAGGAACLSVLTDRP